MNYGGNLTFRGCRVSLGISVHERGTSYRPRKLERTKVANRTKMTITMAVRELTVASSGT